MGKSVNQENNSSALLACPFCGQPPSYVGLSHRTTETAIVCPQCGAVSGDHPTVEAATEAWNKRAVLSTLSGEATGDISERLTALLLPLESELPDGTRRLYLADVVLTLREAGVTFAALSGGKEQAGGGTPNLIDGAIPLRAESASAGRQSSADASPAFLSPGKPEPPQREAKILADIRSDLAELLTEDTMGLVGGKESAKYVASRLRRIIGTIAEWDNERVSGNPQGTPRWELQHPTITDDDGATYEGGRWDIVPKVGATVKGIVCHFPFDCEAEARAVCDLLNQRSNP